MADEYVILADENKLCDTLDFKVPLTVEVMKEAYSYISKKLLISAWSRRLVKQKKKMVFDQRSGKHDLGRGSWQRGRSI